MPRRPHARDHQLYVKRESDPQLGAKRHLEITRGLGDFYADMSTVVTSALGSAASCGTVRLYDDIHEDSTRRPNLKLFERRLVSQFGRRQRIGWTMNDVGTTQTGIRNAVARLAKPEGWHSNGSVDVTFTGVVRAGSGETAKNGKRKFAMIPDQATGEIEYLLREHDAVFNGIKENLRGKSNSKRELTFPYGDFVPQVTLGIFDEGVSNDSKNKVMNAIADQVLPFSCTLEPLILYTNQEVPLGPEDDF